MSNKLMLENWTYEGEKELMDHRYKPARPTGVTVRVWGGWEWTTVSGDVYRTNGEGEGLWKWTGEGYAQLMGTCQFSLPEDRAKARKKLRRLGYDIARRADVMGW